MAGSLLGATPAALPQQGALPCLCSVLAPWLCHHGFILQTPCTNTHSVCKHHPSLTGEHSPQTPLYPNPGGRSRCQPLSEAHPSPVPPSPAPGCTFCAIRSVTRRQQVQFASQRIAKHIWLCQVTPHRWRCHTDPGQSLAFVCSCSGTTSVLGTGGWQLGSMSSP